MRYNVSAIMQVWLVNVVVPFTRPKFFVERVITYWCMVYVIEAMWRSESVH